MDFSTLWRLRRATAIETGLFDIEADRLSDAHLSAVDTVPQLQPPARDVVYAFFRSDRSDGVRSDGIAAAHSPKTITAANPLRLQSQEQSRDEVLATDPSHHLAQCFLRLADLPTYPLDRLSRYEYALWRQVAQILFALENLNRRKPQERRRRSICADRPCPLAFEPAEQ